jgi:hypothetical protein
MKRKRMDKELFYLLRKSDVKIPAIPPKDGEKKETPLQIKK